MKKTNFPATAGSRKMREKSALKLFLIILVIGFVFISLTGAEELTEQAKVTPIIQESRAGTRIIISTSGPAKFTSYWLDEPPRLVVEFQTKNIQSIIENEVMVNQGIIKKITSSYFEEDPKRPLKSLAFELTQKVPYKIWQEADTILLDIQTPPDMAIFSEDGSEVFRKNEAKEVMIKRLEAMGLSLKQRETNQTSTEVPKFPELISSPKSKFIASSETKKGGTPKVIFWLIGLSLISGLGFLIWLLWQRFRLLLDKNMAVREVTKLEIQLQEQNKFLEQERLIRETIEKTSKQKEKQTEQLKLEFQKEQQLLEQEQKARKIAEEGLSQKEKEVVEVKGSLESLKEVLVEKGLAKKLTTPEKEGELWITGKSAERREFPRLDLSKDYNRTIILRIETEDKSNPSTSLRAKSIKSFANNIGLGGLCFDARSDFKEKDRINLRLFFFGDKVPMMRFQAKVIRKKIESPVNRYGVSFSQLEEKYKAELSRYIESKIARG